MCTLLHFIAFEIGSAVSSLWNSTICNSMWWKSWSSLSSPPTCFLIWLNSPSIQNGTRSFLKRKCGRSFYLVLSHCSGQRGIQWKGKLATDWISGPDLEICLLVVHAVITFKRIFCFLCTVPTMAASACQLQGRLFESLPFAEHNFPLSPWLSIYVYFNKSHLRMKVNSTFCFM